MKVIDFPFQKLIKAKIFQDSKLKETVEFGNFPRQKPHKITKNFQRKGITGKTKGANQAK